jgi:hypothetical protein
VVGSQDVESLQVTGVQQAFGVASGPLQPDSRETPNGL